MRPELYGILVFLVGMLATVLASVAMGTSFRPSSSIAIAGSIAVTMYVFHRYESE